MLRRFLAFLLALAAPVLGGGADRTALLNTWTIQEQAAVQEMLGTLMSALREGNAEAVLSLFSETARQDQPDLEMRIKDLLSLCGPELEYEDNGLYSGGGDIKGGKEQLYADLNLPATMNGSAYRMLITLVWRDDLDPANMGIQNMWVLTQTDYDGLPRPFKNEQPGLRIGLSDP